MRLVLTTILAGLAWFASAQSLLIENIAISPDGNVTFDCTVGKKKSDRERYELSIFTNANNFIEAIQYRLSDIEPGRTYHVSFDGNEQIGDFDGDLELRFAVTATLFPVEITTPASTKFKSGKSMDLSWNDPANSGSYRIELLKGGESHLALEEDFKGTSYDGKLPKDLEKGIDYSVVVSPVGNPGLRSEPMAAIISNPLPTWVVLSPLAAAGVAGLIIALIGDDGGDGEDPFPDSPGRPPDT